MGADRPRLLAVTVLTSMDQKAIREVGISGPSKTRVVKLAKLAKNCGRRRSCCVRAGSSCDPKGLWA